MILIYLSLSWITGIFLGSIGSPSAAWYAAAAIPLSIFFVPHWRKISVISCLCLLLVVSGAFYYRSVFAESNKGYTISAYCEDTVVVRGMVEQYPDLRDKSISIILEAEQLNIGGVWKPVNGKVMLYMPRYPEYNYGDILEVYGYLEAPVNFADFDYAGYLAKQNIYTIMFYPEAVLVAHGQGNMFLEWFYTLRYNMGQVLEQILPEPQASLAKAMLLGLRGGIPDDVGSYFMLSGTTHILAISGMNLTIMAGMMVKLGQWILGRRYYLYVWLGMVSIWAYVLICGASPSVTRAALMASIFLLADLTGRQKNAAPALFLSAAIMTLANPLVLWDISFQLSVLAMSGLIYVYPLMQGAGQWVGHHVGDRNKLLHNGLSFIIDSMLVTLAATAAVWPVSVLYFERISLVSPLATLLGVPVMPFIITLGLLTAIAGYFCLPLGYVMGWLTWLFLSYLLLVVRTFANLPGASVEMHASSRLITAGYYAVLLVVIWTVTRWQHQKAMAQLQAQAGNV